MSEPHRLPSRVRLRNLPAARAAAERYLDEVEGEACIDLGALSKSNSAIVALLMALYRRANATEKPIAFVNASDDLRNIIDLYGLTDVLPLGDGRPQHSPESPETSSQR